MRHVSVNQPKFIVSLFCLVSAVGYFPHPAMANEAMPSPQAAPPHAGLIRESRAEADLLRSELATVKIAAAKQRAELRAALERVDTLKAHEESMASSVQQIKNNLLTAESERDQLRRDNVALQVQSASLPDLQLLIAEVHTIQASVHQMVANMKTLMAEVIHIKQDMSRSRRKARSGTASLTAFSMTTASPSVTSNGTWTVKSGDTLWHISQKHGISVNALMEMNQLQSDIIVEGRTLKVPVVASRQPDQEAKHSQMPQSDSPSHTE